jgi:hypothetical protein
MRHLLYIFCLLTGCLFSQTGKYEATKEYFYLYGGKNFDEARSIKELPGKQYIIAGTTSSFGQGNTSVYLIKTDSMGNHLWSYPFGGSQNDWGYSVEVTADSGFFVAGYSNSFNPPNGYDAYYFKVDKNGNLLWQKTVSGSDWDFIYGSTPMPDGGFILCGETYTNSYGNADAYLIRINKNGDTLWNKHYGGVLDEKLNSVCVINNRIYAVGNNLTHATDSISDAWIMKLDTNGNFISQNFIGGVHHYGEEFKGITVYDANTFFVCGKTDLIDSNSTQSMIARMDTSLNFVFGPYPGGLTSAGEYVCFNQVVKTSYGNIYTVGTASGGLGGMNLFMVGFHPDLTWITGFAHDCGLQYNDYGYSGIYSSSGRVVVVGSAQQLCSTNPALGLDDAFLVRYESDSITNAGVTQTITQCFGDTLFYWAATLHNYDKDVHLNLFPNPLTEKAQLEIKCGAQTTFNISIYSVLGNEVMRFNAESNSKNEIDLSALDNGSYFLKLEDKEGKKISVLKFVKAN